MKKDQGTQNETITCMSSSINAEDNKYSVVEFHSPTIAVKENIGKFPVTLWRHGNLDCKAIVRYRIHLTMLQKCILFSIKFN